MFSGLSVLAGRFRGLFLPLGFFALLSIGIHAGSDYFDEYAFAALNAVDAVLDSALTSSIGFVLGLFGVSGSTTAEATYRAVTFIDLETKRTLAALAALSVELCTDLILALPVFLFRHRATDLGKVLKRAFTDPTVLRIVLPLSAAFASVAGGLVVSRAIQARSYAIFIDLHASTRTAGNLAGVLGALALVLVLWRLGFYVFIGAARWADLRAKNDAAMAMSSRRRRMRGFATALVAFPISCLSLFEASSVLSHLRSLIPG